MLGFILRRVALIIPTFFGVTLLAFSLIHLIPGDPVETLSGERGMDPARRERLLHEFGLDRPLPVQYGGSLRDGFPAPPATSLTTPPRGPAHGQTPSPPTHPIPLFPLPLSALLRLARGYS